jgi:hypothetical protein
MDAGRDELDAFAVGLLAAPDDDGLAAIGSRERSLLGRRGAGGCEGGDGDGERERREDAQRRSSSHRMMSPGTMYMKYPMIVPKSHANPAPMLPLYI